MRKAMASVCLALFVLLTPVAALGQAVYGNVVGSVTDPSGAAVPNAKVTITDTARAVTFNAQTNEDGNFTFRGLIAGNYQVRIEASGFKAALQSVVVSVDQESRSDVKLEVGDVSQVVEISAEAPLLKTERADVAVTFSEKTVISLPLINRRFSQFELLTPGVQATTSQTASSEDPQGSFRKVVNGQSFAGTTQLLDGTDNRDARIAFGSQNHHGRLRSGIRRDRGRHQRPDQIGNERFPRGRVRIHAQRRAQCAQSLHAIQQNPRY
jgi:Carboxypeptidase regulatory-like domain